MKTNQIHYTIKSLLILAFSVIAGMFSAQNVLPSLATPVLLGNGTILRLSKPHVRALFIIGLPAMVLIIFTGSLMVLNTY